MTGLKPGAKCVLMGYIDDASGKVFGRFYKYEGTIPAMDSFKRYIRKYDIPMSVYMDKHTTYKSPAEPSIEEELAGLIHYSANYIWQSADRAWGKAYSCQLPAGQRSC